MTAFLWTLIFLVTLLLGLLCRLALSGRQQRAVLAHRNAPPAAFARKVSLAAHQKAADYTIAKQRFFIVTALFDAAVLLAWTIGGGVAWFASLTAALPPFWRDVVLVVAVSLIGGLIALPFSFYQTFSIEARFGFNKTTRALWVADLIKSTAVGLVIGVPVLMFFLWALGDGRASSLQSWWWVFAWAVITAFQFVMMIIYPTFIAPLFNKFTPMPEDDTRRAIEALLSRCGFALSGLFVMDGSRRSAHGNAYFTGFGRAKRIVFFDTLLSRLKQEEILAVLAHELGHFKKHHIKKRMVLSTVVTLVIIALLVTLMNASWFYEGLGFAADDAATAASRPAIALTLFMLTLPVFSFFLTPITAWYSRCHEFEADDYAVKQTSKAALTNALVCLYEENAATITPDVLYSMFYDSHPPAPVRIAHLDNVASTTATT